MTFRAAARPAQGAFRSLCQNSRTSSLSYRKLSSKPNASEGYVDIEHKRKLVSLYHKSENFVTHENLSDYIDKEFTKSIQEPNRRGFTDQGLGRFELEQELNYRQQNTPKWVVPPAQSGEIGGSLRYHYSSTDVVKEQTKRLKAALYGVDEETLETSVEMAQKHQKTDSVDLFEEDGPEDLGRK